MLLPSAVSNKDKRKTGSFFDAQYCVTCDKPFFYNGCKCQHKSDKSVGKYKCGTDER